MQGINILNNGNQYNDVIYCEQCYHVFEKQSDLQIYKDKKICLECYEQNLETDLINKEILNTNK